VKETIEIGQETTRDTMKESFHILASVEPHCPEGFITERTWMRFSKVYSPTRDCTWDAHDVEKLFFPAEFISLEMWLLAVPELAQPGSSLRHYAQGERSAYEYRRQRALGALHLAVDLAVVLSLFCTVHQTEALMVTKRPIWNAPKYLQAVHFTCCGLYIVEAVARKYVLDNQHFGTHRVFVDTVIGVTCSILELLLCLVGPGEPLWRYCHNQEGKLSRLLALLRVARVERVLWRFEGKRETLRVLLRLVGAFKRASAGLFFVFYLYSTVGVQIFGGRIRKDMHRLRHEAFGAGGYWANNFNDFASGLVVLFELMVVNNWFVIAEGLAKVSPGSGCVGWFFCISFYFFVHMVILNVLVASVVAGYERIRDDDATLKRNVVEDLKVATSHSFRSQEDSSQPVLGARETSPLSLGSYLTLSAPIESLTFDANMKDHHFEESALLLERDVENTKRHRLQRLRTLAFHEDSCQLAPLKTEVLTFQPL